MILKKNRDRKLSSNYRPISLLSCIGKCYVRLIKNALDAATTRLGTIPEIHSGFRKNRSTQENFLRLSEGIAESFKRKNVTVGAFLDLDKAFHRIHHDSLRVKLIRQHLPPKIIRSISSFLRDRILCRRGDRAKRRSADAWRMPPGKHSFSFPLHSPFRWRAYNLRRGWRRRQHLRRRLELWISAKNLDEAIFLLQRRINIFATWCDKWRLSPAPSKLYAIAFSRKKSVKVEAKNRTILMNGDKINWSNDVCFLGVIYDEDLNFKSHLDKLIKNSYGKIRSIRRLCQHGINLDTEIMVGLIHSLILSTFLYSAPAYLGISPLTWRRVLC